MSHFKLFTGIRPTGRLHLGHYYGVIRNWVHLQSKFRCLFCIADLHSLSSSKSNGLIKSARGVLEDCLSVGVDPNKSIIFNQSGVPEHAELCSVLCAFSSPTKLQRNPNLHLLQSNTITNFNYPTLMAADMLLYNTHFVSVGPDQIPHIEMAREIIRKLEAACSKAGQYLTPGLSLVEPTYLLSKHNTIIGSDGYKMSKSLGNSISINAKELEVANQIQTTKTDPLKKRSGEGLPAICSGWHNLKNNGPAPLSSKIGVECAGGFLDCSNCKRLQASAVLKKQSEFLLKPMGPHNRSFLDSILSVGCLKARQQASRTLKYIRNLLKLSGD